MEPLRQEEGPAPAEAEPHARVHEVKARLQLSFFACSSFLGVESLVGSRPLGSAQHEASVSVSLDL